VLGLGGSGASPPAYAARAARRRPAGVVPPHTPYASPAPAARQGSTTGQAAQMVNAGRKSIALVPCGRSGNMTSVRPRHAARDRHESPDRSVPAVNVTPPVCLGTPTAPQVLDPGPRRAGPRPRPARSPPARPRPARPRGLDPGRLVLGDSTPGCSCSIPASSTPTSSTPGCSCSTSGGSRLPLTRPSLLDGLVLVLDALAGRLGLDARHTRTCHGHVPQRPRRVTDTSRNVSACRLGRSLACRHDTSRHTLSRHALCVCRVTLSTRHT